MKTMVFSLSFSFIYQCKPFFTLFKRKKKKYYNIYFTNAKFPQKSILGLILIRL
jgi:hypothetical protein